MTMIIAIRILKKLHVPLLFLISVSSVCAGPPPDIEGNAPCMSKVQIPNYPRLASAARLDGDIVAIVDLDANAKMNKVTMTFKIAHFQARLILGKEVEKALYGSIFDKSCAGKQVRLQFSFVLDVGEPSSQVKQSFSFSYPNLFSISVSPTFVQQ